MRYYSFKILNGAKSVFSQTLDSSNPEAPRIEFQIQSVNDFGNSGYPSFVKLYNTTLDFITEAPKLQGMTLKLDAGFSYSPLYKNSAASSLTSQTLFNGSIIGSQTTIEGRDVVTAFYLTPLSVGEPEDASVCDIEIASGGVVADAFKKSLQKIWPSTSTNAPSISITSGANLITHQSEQKFYLQATQVDGVKGAFFWLQNLAKKFGLTIGYEAPINTIYIAADPSSKVNSLDANTLNVANLSSTIIASASDFLAQPNWESITTATFKMNLSPKYRLFNMLQVPNTIVFTNSTLLSSTTAALGGSSLSLIGGNFLITQITHIGDSRSNSAESWMTELQGVSITL